MLVKNSRGIFKEVVAVAHALHVLDIGLAVGIAGIEIPRSFFQLLHARPHWLKVFDVELQKQMVTELNVYVMKCVCDHNGNHIIQKCIEYVPQDRIHFIVASFFGHVVSLSTHPYGCHGMQSP